MKHRILFISVASFAFAVAMSAQTPAAAPIPHLEKRGAVTQLIVDGRPWLGLAGELLNNAASTAENVRPVWPNLAKANLNTVLMGVGWGWTEPEEGKFDFSALDGALGDARLNGLHVVLLWFGSWKNGTSSYPPAWVKRNPDKYPVARDKDGKGREILSTLSTTNMEADGRAYAALMRHVRETDPTHTVIMIQMENEVGLLGDSRDRSKEANEAFAATGSQGADGLPAEAQGHPPAGNQEAVGRRRRQDVRNLGRGFWQWHRRRRGLHGLALRALHEPCDRDGQEGVTHTGVRERLARSTPGQKARRLPQRRSASPQSRLLAGRRAADRHTGPRTST